MASAPSNPAAAALYGILLAACTWPAASQIYRLDNVPAPDRYSLMAYHPFYVYGEDAPTSRPTAGSVEFQMLSFQVSGSEEPPKNYGSLQVSLLPAGLLSQSVATPGSCGPHGRLRFKDGVGNLSVPRSGSSAPVNKTFPIRKSGKYLLAVSNCGEFSSATISGTVSVSSAHGRLPANQLNAMHVFGWLAGVQTLVLLVWVAGMMRHAAGGLLHVHRGVALVAGLCVVEAVSARMEHAVWNATGDRSSLLGALRNASSTLKFVYLWRVVLLPPLSAGEGSGTLDGKSALAYFVLSALFIVQGCIWRTVFSSRCEADLDDGLFARVALPGVAITTAAYAWTFKALSGHVRLLKARQSTELLGAFLGMRAVVIASMALSVMAVLLQFAFLGDALAWELQWVIDQGSHQLSFMAVLVSVMLVWWPSQQGAEFLPIETADDDEAKPSRSVWGVAPEPIGAGGAE